jgi:hypothetical protein
LLGTSDVGTADADAAPTSEKVNPAAPNAGTAFVTRFRFEACFTPGIVVPPYLQKNVSSPAREILRLANAPCKIGDMADVPCVLDFHVHERRVHERLRARPAQSSFPFIAFPTIAMRDRLGALTNSRHVSTFLRAGDAVSVVAFVSPRRYFSKDLAFQSCVGKSSQVGPMLRCDCL